MNFLTQPMFVNIFYAVFLVVVGYFVASSASKVVDKLTKKKFSRHHAQLFRRFVFYVLFLLFAITGLQHTGFNLSVLLGAAGILTVAISFASQTAASNLVSGIFMLFESPFKVGDMLNVKGIIGTVESIDLLSTKLKTFDNQLVRIPNETMIKSEITNMSYFPIRRADIFVGISYNTDVNKAKALLLELADKHAEVLKDPVPRVIIDDFADSSINLKFMIWTKTDMVFAVRNEFREIIKNAFDESGIEIPFPQMTLHRA